MPSQREHTPTETRGKFCRFKQRTAVAAPGQAGLSGAHSHSLTHSLTHSLAHSLTHSHSLPLTPTHTQAAHVCELTTRQCETTSCRVVDCRGRRKMEMCNVVSFGEFSSVSVQLCQLIGQLISTATPPPRPQTEASHTATCKHGAF